MKQRDDEPIPYALTQPRCRNGSDAAYCGAQSVDPRRRCALKAGHAGAHRYSVGVPAVQDASCGPEAPRLRPAAAAALGSRSPSVLPEEGETGSHERAIDELFHGDRQTVAGTTDSLCPECGKVMVALDHVCPTPPQGVPAIETSTRCVGSTKYETPAIREVTCKNCKELISALGAAIEEYNAYTRPKLADYAGLSYQDVNALKETIVFLGARVRKAHEAFKSHADICRKTSR